MFGLNPLLYLQYRSLANDYPGPKPAAGDSTTSFEWDPEERKRARAAAIMQLGVGIMSGAGTGHFSEGLASGLQGFSQSMMDARQAERQRQRQGEQDRLQHEEHDSSMESAKLNREVVTTQQANIAQDRADKDASEARRRAAAAAMVKDIEAENGPDSPEAKRARSFLMLGEDVDLGRLEDLHKASVDQSPEGVARRARLFQEETNLSIDRAGDMAAHGYGPEAEGRRSEAQLAMERDRLALARQQEARIASWGPGYGMGGPGAGMKPDQYNDNIRIEAESIYSSWLRARFEGVGKRPEGAAGYGQPPKAAPTDAEMHAARVAAEEEATRNFNARLKAAGFPGRDPGANPAPAPGAVLHYDAGTGSLKPGPHPEPNGPPTGHDLSMNSDAIAQATIAHLPPELKAKAVGLAARGVPPAQILRLLGISR